MNLQPIKFRNVAHLRRVIEDYLAIAGPLSGIVAAVLSLWRWEQQGAIFWPCALCREYLNRKSSNCSSCSLRKVAGLACYNRYSLFSKAIDNRENIQPLLDALHNAVLLECVEEYGRRCAESVREALK